MHLTGGIAVLRAACGIIGPYLHLNTPLGGSPALRVLSTSAHTQVSREDHTVQAANRVHRSSATLVCPISSTDERMPPHSKCRNGSRWSRRPAQQELVPRIHRQPCICLPWKSVRLLCGLFRGHHRSNPQAASHMDRRHRTRYRRGIRVD